MVNPESLIFNEKHAARSSRSSTHIDLEYVLRIQPQNYPDPKAAPILRIKRMDPRYEAGRSYGAVGAVGGCVGALLPQRAGSGPPNIWF